MPGLSSLSSSTSPLHTHRTLSLSRCPLFFNTFSSLFVQFGAVFMHVEHPSDLSRLSRIAAYYLMAVTFYTVIWSARLSILFSIIRIDPDPLMRYRLKWLAAAFVAAVLGLFFQLFWVCEHIHGWKNKASPQCPLPKQVAIFQLICAYPFGLYWTLFLLLTEHPSRHPCGPGPHPTTHPSHPRHQGQAPTVAPPLHLLHLQ